MRLPCADCRPMRCLPAGTRLLGLSMTALFFPLPTLPLLGVSAFCLWRIWGTADTCAFPLLQAPGTQRGIAWLHRAASAVSAQCACSWGVHRSCRRHCAGQLTPVAPAWRAAGAADAAWQRAGRRRGQQRWLLVSHRLGTVDAGLCGAGASDHGQAKRCFHLASGRQQPCSEPQQQANCSQQAAGMRQARLAVPAPQRGCRRGAGAAAVRPAEWRRAGPGVPDRLVAAAERGIQCFTGPGWPSGSAGAAGASRGPALASGLAMRRLALQFFIAFEL